MFKKRRINLMTKALVFGFIAVLVVLSSSAGFAQAFGDGFDLGANTQLLSINDFSENVIYLPLAFQNFPTIPGVPVLDPISNADGDGSYTVNWSVPEGANSYILEEADNASFSSSVTVYTGSDNSASISGKDVGTYYYRVQAANPSASSGWSNVESVAVTVPLPACPQTVAWMGISDLGRIMPFEIEDSPQCHILAYSLSIRFADSCGNNIVQTFNYDIPITGGRFETTTTGGTTISGNFLTPVTLEGTYAYESESGVCTASGTWTAAYNLGANDDVRALAVQADGKILVGGDFTTLGGQRRSYLGRLNADGSLDNTFNPEANNSVLDIALQSNGQIVIGGRFKNVNGVARYYIARLNQDGTLDASFSPGESSYGGFVSAIVVQPDQKLLVGGGFDSMAGEAAPRIARINPDGSADLTFSPELAKERTIYALALQSDNKIILGMRAASDDYGYVPIYRLNSDGSLDDTFVKSLHGPVNIPPTVNTLAIQDNGQILVGGHFYEGHLIRLNSDGSDDSAFNVNSHVSFVDTFYDSVLSVVVQADGKILVGGGIAELNYEDHYGLGRLNADGTLDTTFNPLANNQVNVLALQTNAKILVGGGFFGLNGQSRNYLGRLNADGSLDTAFP